MKPPIKNFKLSLYPNGDVTQWFAENPDLYAFMGLKGHNGIDIVRPWGEPIYAVEDGVVMTTKEDPKGFGKNIRVISDEKNINGNYNVWSYCHNSVNFVKQGDKVKAGQKIALMGNTGFVVSGNTPFWKNNPYAGTHLHLGLREAERTNRGWSYEGSSIKHEIVNYDNGFKGSIDPYPFLAGLTKEETKYRSQQLTLISLLNTLKNLLKK